MAENTPSQTDLLAELNDLLQLDHDAVQAYTLAINALESAVHKRTLEEYRADHERHIVELTRLIQAAGGTPIEMSHIPSGAFKLAVQAVGAAGGDRAVLLAFKSNEWQVSEKYRRHAERPHAPDVADVLLRAANDEEKHYAWAAATLEQMDAGRDTAVGKAEGAFEKVHGAAADVMESAERKVLEGIEKLRDR